MADTPCRSRFRKGAMCWLDINKNQLTSQTQEETEKQKDNKRVKER